jgi:hypothetical protein
VALRRAADAEASVQRAAALEQQLAAAQHKVCGGSSGGPWRDGGIGVQTCCAALSCLHIRIHHAHPVLAHSTPSGYAVSPSSHKL